MVNPNVIAHLEKYFRLSQKHFKDDDHALAAFFAITTIEETSKLLILRDKDLPQVNRERIIKETFSHKTKYFSALINLIDQSPNYQTLPRDLQKQVDSWWDTKKLMTLRNDALYMNLNKNEEPRTPANVISTEQAALLVYIAGIALAELDEYITGLPTGWRKSILEVTDTFRQQYLSR